MTNRIVISATRRKCALKRKIEQVMNNSKIQVGLYTPKLFLPEDKLFDWITWL